MESYGHTEDDQIILRTLSIPNSLDDPLEGANHSGVPLFYIIDVDEDGIIDTVYLDKDATYSCEEFEFFVAKEVPEEKKEEI